LEGRETASSAPQTPHQMSVDLTNVQPGDARLTVSMKGGAVQSLQLKVLPPRAQVQAVEHAELDEHIQVTGHRLDRVEALQWEGGLCQPRDILRSPEGLEQLSMTCNVDIRSNASLPAAVSLRHKGGEPEPLRAALQKRVAAPRVALSSAANALLVRPSPKALQWGLKPQDELLSDDSGLSVLLQTVEGYAPGKGSYTLQLRFVDDPATARKPITAPLMADPVHKELRTRVPVRFKGVDLPSVVNPLEWRVLHDASGLASPWIPAKRSVLMLPDITSASCAPQGARVWLHGAQLDLIDGARFMEPGAGTALAPVVLEPCPDGLCLSLPQPTPRQRLHVSLGWLGQRVFVVETGPLGDCKAP
jgi:hypothetical protein